MSDPTDLVAWLNACYDRAEQAALAATPGPWTVSVPDCRESGCVCDLEVHAGDRDVVSKGYQDGGIENPADAAHIADHDPAWRLGDIGRKRKILAEHQPVKATSERRWSSGLSCVICDDGFPDYPCKTVRLLAEEFASEPGYDERWRR